MSRSSPTESLESLAPLKRVHLEDTFNIIQQYLNCNGIRVSIRLCVMKIAHHRSNYDTYFIWSLSSGLSSLKRIQYASKVFKYPGNRLWAHFYFIVSWSNRFSVRLTRIVDFIWRCSISFEVIRFIIKLIGFKEHTKLRNDP